MAGKIPAQSFCSNVSISLLAGVGSKGGCYMKHISLLLCMRSLLLVLADVDVESVGKLEVPIVIAAIRIIGMGQNRKFLLRMPLQQPIAFGWIVNLVPPPG